MSKEHTAVKLSRLRMVFARLQSAFFAVGTVVT